MIISFELIKNMNKCILDDNHIIRMYCDMDMSLRDIGEFYNVSKITIRRHLKHNNVQIRPNGVRIGMTSWSIEEDELLIKARVNGITGQELSEAVPTRTYGAIKARIHKLKLQKKLR